MVPSLLRFLRVVGAFVLAALLKAVNDNLGMIEFPAEYAGYVVPLLAAVLAAVGKFLRDKYGIEYIV